MNMVGEKMFEYSDFYDFDDSSSDEDDEDVDDKVGELVLARVRKNIVFHSFFFRKFWKFSKFLQKFEKNWWISRIFKYFFYIFKSFLKIQKGIIKY